MATLLIRDLDEDVKSRLRVQAAGRGRSMEAEARALLGAALNGRRPARGLGSYVRDSGRRRTPAPVHFGTDAW